MKRISNMPSNTARLAVVLSLLALSGCAHYADYAAFIHEDRPLVTSTTYLLAPPDTILITSKLVRELNGHREQIRPDGMITLPLFGSIFVAGRTCEEVSTQLAEMAQDYYEDADVSVRVVNFASKKIFVFGEVSAAGPYSYNGANTVLQTLADAQPTRLADPKRIHILRPNENNELVRRMTIDLDRMVKRGETELDAVLEEGDIIYVPANGLAMIGLTFQQLLLPLQPAAATVNAPVQFSNSFTRRPYGGPSNLD